MNKTPTNESTPANLVLPEMDYTKLACPTKTKACLARVQQENPTTEVVEPNKSTPKSKKAATPKATKKRRQSSRGKTGRRNRNKGSEETIPKTLRLTPSGYSALQLLAAENQEMSRVHIVSIALEEKAGRIVHQRPIHLSKTRKEDLLSIASLTAIQEKFINGIIRRIIRCKFDIANKEVAIDELECEIKNLKDFRNLVCRTAYIPITHDLIGDVDMAIRFLTDEMNNATNSRVKTAMYNVILLLANYKPVDFNAIRQIPTT